MRARAPHDRLELLRGVPLFRGLSNKELARVDQLITTVALEPGQVLTTEGKSGRQAFIIVSGHAKVTIAGRSVAIVGPGEVVGEMALVDGQPRTATVVAMEPIQALVVDPGGFRALLAEPRIVRKLLHVEIGRLRLADSQAPPATTDDMQRTSRPTQSDLDAG